jgi:hypothetical protein
VASIGSMSFMNASVARDGAARLSRIKMAVGPIESRRRRANDSSCPRQGMDRNPYISPARFMRLRKIDARHGTAKAPATVTWFDAQQRRRTPRG